MHRMLHGQSEIAQKLGVVLHLEAKQKIRPWSCFFFFINVLKVSINLIKRVGLRRLVTFSQYTQIVRISMWFYFRSYCIKCALISSHLPGEFYSNCCPVRQRHSHRSPGDCNPPTTTSRSIITTSSTILIFINQSTAQVWINSFIFF